MDCMEDADRMAEVDDLVLRMGDLLYEAGLAPFDRVRYRTAEEEVWFIWSAEKKVVIVELRDTSLDALRGAITHNVRPADPALN